MDAILSGRIGGGEGRGVKRGGAETELVADFPSQVASGVRTSPVYVSLCLCVSVFLCLCVSVSLCLCVSVSLCLCLPVPNPCPSVPLHVFDSLLVCLAPPCTLGQVRLKSPIREPRYTFNEPRICDTLNDIWYTLVLCLV